MGRGSFAVGLLGSSGAKRVGYGFKASARRVRLLIPRSHEKNARAFYRPHVPAGLRKKPWTKVYWGSGGGAAGALWGSEHMLREGFLPYQRARSRLASIMSRPDLYLGAVRLSSVRISFTQLFQVPFGLRGVRGPVPERLVLPRADP